MYAEIQGKGQIRAKILKHLSPITTTKIQRAVPFGGRLNFFERNFAYIITPVVQGEEKARLEFEPGELAFLPGGSMLCFFLKKTKSQKSMNPLGTLDPGSIELLGRTGRGDSLQVTRIVPQFSPSS